MRARGSRGLALALLGLGSSACSGLMQLGAVKKAVEANYEHHYADAAASADYILATQNGTPDGLQELYLLKAEAYEGLGRKGEAIAIYRFVIQTYRESGAASQARGRLDALGVSCGQ